MQVSFISLSLSCASFISFFFFFYHYVDTQGISCWCFRLPFLFYLFFNWNIGSTIQLLVMTPWLPNSIFAKIQMLIQIILLCSSHVSPIPSWEESFGLTPSDVFSHTSKRVALMSNCLYLMTVYLEKLKFLNWFSFHLKILPSNLHHQK